jgi:putative membrane protein
MSILHRAALAAGGLLATLVIAAAPASAAPSQQDTTWMVSAHQGNLAEIAAGKAAQQKGASEGVRSMGAELVNDHTALDKELTAAAQQLGVDLPQAPSQEQQTTLDQVMSQQGAAFDTAWISAQLAAHQTTKAEGQKEISQGQDPTVVNLAETAAPVIQRHLDGLMALSTGAPMTVPTGDGSTAQSPALLGAGLVVLGALAVAASAALVVRRRRTLS